MPNSQTMRPRVIKLHWNVASMSCCGPPYFELSPHCNFGVIAPEKLKINKI